MLMSITMMIVALKIPGVVICTLILNCKVASYTYNMHTYMQ